MPWGTGRRIVAAVLAAALAIAALQIWIHEGGDVVAAAPAEPFPVSSRLPAHLRRAARLLYLSPDATAVPEAAAPVVAVLEDGRLQVLRRPPLPDSPEPRPWQAVGVVLPRPTLAELSPVQRVAFLDVCSGFSGGDRLVPEQFRGLGFAFGTEELRRLLYWLR